MKTVSVRIGEKQAKRLQEISDLIIGGSINGMVQRSVDLWLEVEGPVYLAHLKQAQHELGDKRQAVMDVA